MKPRMLLLFAFVALAGAAVAVLPALAAPPQEVKLEVNENCYIEKWPCWNIKADNPENIRQIQPFTLAQGGTVAFEDHDPEAPTDVIWKGAAPACTGVPSTPQTGWSGTCTFSGAGEYAFESERLFNDGTFNYTKYKVIVEATGGAGTTGTSTETTSSTATGPYPSPPAPVTAPQGVPISAAGGTPLLYAGSPSSAFKLPAAERGQAVHGAIDVSPAGAGGRLEAQALASTAALAGAGHAARPQEVGRVVRSSLAAGDDPFTVPLDARARRALRARHRLALTVRVVITSSRGASDTLTRSVLLRA